MQEKENWCNTTAYPVESIYWEGKKYSRVDAATILFFKIKKYLANIIQRSEGNIIRATKSINKHFKISFITKVFCSNTKSYNNSILIYQKIIKCNISLNKLCS